MTSRAVSSRIQFSLNLLFQKKDNEMNFKSLLKIKGKIYNGAPSRTLNVISGPALVQFPKGVSFL